jgi:hypothetical protein
MTRNSNFIPLLVLFVHLSRSAYFISEPDKWRCFKDNIVANYVSPSLNVIITSQTLEMEVQILDDEVLSQLVEANDQLKREGKIQN